MKDETELDLEKYKARLLAHKEELLKFASTGNDAAKTVELDQTRVGRLSRMDALQGQAMSIETKRRRDIELQKIDAALRRIEQQDYGYCLSCGELISPRRLDVDPATPLCIDCANKSDQR